LKAVETDGDIVYIAPGIGDVKKEYAKEIGGFELKEVIYGAGYTTIDDSLKITIPNLVYKGMKMNITVVMDRYQNFDDPNGFYLIKQMKNTFNVSHKYLYHEQSAA
jgi:hypothetical protein